MRLALVALVLFLATGEGTAALRIAALSTALVLAGAWFALWVRRALAARRRRRAYRSAQARAKLLVAEHLDILARRRLSLERTDRYGVVDRTAWQKEMRHFAENVLLPGLSRAERDEVARRGTARFLARVLESPVDARARERRRSLTAVGAANATEFEIACADRLAGLGWRAEVTPASGDQGADIVAWKGATCAVIQCKMYKGSVGNAAVQQVLGAKLYYDADVAAVITTSDYTKAAVRLAERSDVLLLRSGDLDSFDRLVRTHAAG
jgi:restriction system protein